VADFKSVDAYRAAQPEPAQKVVELLRGVIRKALPSAEEGISYQMPTYRLGGRVALYFAVWKKHYSIYPATARLIAAFKEELAPYECNDKGTIRFPLSAPVPAALIERIAKFRAKEIAEEKP
jgi:uncharacterized protein YdhG (YjbR/CyaY superfamily)